MRIRVIQKPTQECIDGYYPLRGFRVGEIYELEGVIAALFVAEGWGEPLLPTSSASANDKTHRQSAEPSKPPGRAASFPFAS